MSKKKLLIILLIAIPIATIIYKSVTDPLLNVSDTGNHLSFSLDFTYNLENVWESENLNIFQKVSESINLLSADLPMQGPMVPNLTYLATSFFYIIFGKSIESALLINYLFLLIIIIFVYRLSVEISNRKTALVSVCILLISPEIIEYMRQYGTDFPLTAFVIAAFYFLIKNDDFKNIKYSILLAITCGLGMNIKVQFAIFLGLPIAVSLIKGLLTMEDEKKGIYLNVCIFFFIFLSLSMLWSIENYFRALNWVLDYARIESRYYTIFPDVRRKMFRSFFYEVRMIRNPSLISRLPLLSIYAVSFFYLLKSKMKHKTLFILFFIPFFLFAFSELYMQTRHFLPFIPLISAVSSLCIVKAIQSKKGRIFFSVTIIAGFLFFFNNINTDTEMYRRIVSFQGLVDDVIENIQELNLKGRENFNIIYHNFEYRELDVFFIRYLFRLRGQEYCISDFRVTFYASYQRFLENRIDFLLLSTFKDSSVSEIMKKDFFLKNFHNTLDPYMVPLLWDSSITDKEIYNAVSQTLFASELVFSDSTEYSRWLLYLKPTSNLQFKTH